MSFPTTSLLTAFSGANESPISESGKWSGSLQSGGGLMKVVSNQAASVSGGGDGIRTDVSSADLEAWADVPTLPTSGNAAQVLLRVQNPGNASTAAAYSCGWWNGSGFGIWKLTGGSTWTQVGSYNATHTLVAGESIGASIVGTTITVYYKSSGTWTQIISTTDSSITGAGTIGMAMDDTTGRLDNFGGGVYSSGTFNDSPSGTITLSGSNTESASHDSSPSGTITLSGSLVESVSYSDTMSGTITLGGTIFESPFAVHLLTPAVADSGSLTPAGSGTGTLSPASAGTGTLSPNLPL